MLKYAFVVVLTLDHLFSIGHKFCNRCFFFFGKTVVQANTSDYLTYSFSVRSFLPTFVEVGLWWVEKTLIGLLAFFLRLLCLSNLLLPWYL